MAATNTGRRERFPYPLQISAPTTPAYTNSSPSHSPSLSSFSSSARLQNTMFSNSTSALLPSPGLGLGVSMERTGSLPVTMPNVKEESNRDIEEEYFEFDQITFEPYNATCEAYDLTDHPAYDAPFVSSTRLRSESLSSQRLPKLGRRIPSTSNRWRSTTRSSAETYVSDILDDKWRSRANSAASVTSQSTCVSQDAVMSVRNSQDKARHSGHSLGAISIEKANSIPADDEDAVGSKATTPLLPPVWSEFPFMASSSDVTSPLQSPTVAEAFDKDTLPPMTSARTSMHRSPPLSTKPSVASLTARPRGMTLMTSISGDGAPPLVLNEVSDEWSFKLGHANFTIQPEPYVPETSDATAFRKFREDWDTARTNYAKHLVRTGENYGETSIIYRLTQEKWQGIEDEWKKNLETIVTNDVKFGAILGLTVSNMSPTDSVKIPRLHNKEKFPELGDEEIVGPMSVGPAVHSSIRCKSPKRRNVFRFLHGLVTRPQPGLATAR